MADHTPIPWGHSVDQNKAVVIYALEDDEGLAEMVLVDGDYLSEEDAEFIVTACNNKKQLLDALKAIYNATHDSKIERMAEAAIKEAQ